MQKIYFYILSIISLIIVACSTEHNTWYSRHYQTLTSQFNILFNGQEAFKNGIHTIEDKYSNDYSHILPVYEFSDKQTASSASSDMETALKKSHKLIQLHSITTKPAPKGNETEKDKRFRSQEEFNPLVDDAYLLIGKANVVLHENDEAIEVFDYIARKYPTDPSAYESKIWKSIAYMQLNQPINALTALESYDIDGLAPVSLYGQFMAAYANVLINTEKYSEAIHYMEEAVKHADNKHNRSRYKYILAQLYRSVGRNKDAAPLFLELSKGMSDYDMAFAAKLDLATVATTPEELVLAEKKLNKMAKDPKNTDQLDQIYYAIGQMDLNKGLVSTALGDFQKSIETSVINDNQKGLSFLAKADIYYKSETGDGVEYKYINASESFDSASVFLDSRNLRKAESQTMAAQLKPLASELRTIREQDSLLRIANMDTKSREKFINDILEKIKEEEQARIEAAEAEEEQGMSQSEFRQLTRNTNGSNSSSQWYFYNTTMVNAGKSTFRSKWGRRPNEDNWRRSDKSSNAFSADEQENMFNGGNNNNAEANKTNGSGSESDEQKDTEAAAENGPVTRESLLAGLPLTEQQKIEANDKIDNSLFNSGAILYNDLYDYTGAIIQFNAFLNRKPQYDDDNCYNALVMLYFAQTKNSQKDEASKTAEIIKSHFADTQFASFLSTHDFFTQKELANAESEMRYQHTYEAYLAGNYAEAITSASEQIDRASQLKSKYLLVRSLSYAKQGQTLPFRADLTDITTQFAGSDEAALAQKLLDILDQGQTPIKETYYESPLAESTDYAESEQVTADQFVYVPDTTHTIICFINKDVAKEAQFTVADYNFSNYLLEDLDIRTATLANKQQAIVINGFTSKIEAMNYFYSIRDKEFWKEFISTPIPEIYVVSDNNLKLVLLSSSIDEYKAFFDEYYINRIITK